MRFTSRLISTLVCLLFSLNVFAITAAQRFAATQTPAAFLSTLSLNFGGTNQWVNRTSAAAQVFTTTGTWSMWIKGSGIGNFAPVFQNGENTSTATRGPTITDGGDVVGKVSVQWFDASNQTRIRSSITVFDGTWHQLVITYSSGTTKIYVDRVLDTGTVVVVNGGVTTLNTTTYGMHAGAQVTGTTPATFLNAKLNNMSLWNVVLNQTEINALASNGHPADLSTHTQFSHCKGWYRFGNGGDTIAANGLLDSSGNSLPLTPNNMVSGDIVADAP